MKVKGLNIALIVGLILTLILFNNGNVSGQDALFNQYDNNPVFINPGKISRFPQKTGIINQRFQNSSNSNYSTSQVTFVLPIYQQQNYTQKNQVNHKGAVGLSIFNDVSGGSFKTTSGIVNFAYNWNLDPNMEHIVSFGISPGFMKLSVDLNNYTWGEQYGDDGFDPNYVPGSIPEEDRATVFDVGFGTYWTYTNKKLSLNGIRNIDGGISIGHLNSPNISTINNNESKLPVIFKIHSSIFYALNDKYFTGARVLYIQQQKNSRVNLGGVFGVSLAKSGDYISSTRKSDFNFMLKEFYMDLWVNTNNSFGFATNFDFTNYKLGFSYEPNYSTFSISNKLGSAYEIFLRVNIPDRKK